MLQQSESVSPKKRLNWDTAANVAIVITCSFAAVLLGIRIWESQTAVDRTSGAFRTQEKMDPLPGVDYADSVPSIVD